MVKPLCTTLADDTRSPAPSATGPRSDALAERRHYTLAETSVQLEGPERRTTHRTYGGRTHQANRLLRCPSILKRSARGTRHVASAGNAPPYFSTPSYAVRSNPPSLGPRALDSGRPGSSRQRHRDRLGRDPLPRAVNQVLTGQVAPEQWR